MISLFDTWNHPCSTILYPLEFALDPVRHVVQECISVIQFGWNKGVHQGFCGWFSQALSDWTNIPEVVVGGLADVINIGLHGHLRIKDGTKVAHLGLGSDNCLTNFNTWKVTDNRFMMRWTDKQQYRLKTAINISEDSYEYIFKTRVSVAPTFKLPKPCQQNIPLTGSRTRLQTRFLAGHSIFRLLYILDWHVGLHRFKNHWHVCMQTKPTAARISTTRQQASRAVRGEVLIFLADYVRLGHAHLNCVKGGHPAVYRANVGPKIQEPMTCKHVIAINEIFTYYCSISGPPHPSQARVRGSWILC